MTINYNVTGSERKRLVQAISEIMECDAKYKGAPTFAYEVDYFTIDKNGVLSFDDRADSKEIEKLIEGLAERGFEFDGYDKTVLTIEMPRLFFSDTALENLSRLVESKGSLIKKALGVTDLSILKGEETVGFPWFPDASDPDAVKAYTHLVTALCEMAKTQKRVSATDKPVDNEKYAFRCFLLRLGFIGSEYKAERKILLSKLTGSSAFKQNNCKAVDEDE
ncbi:virulence protein [Dehalococcoides mccartyi]|uniref:virulence protein n=1 Tax=Dehalococcoides mccartyi TaxID=61435 RepID=UPI00098E8C05|nr:virulence protein [Dehalococcoides mccartyi]AQU05394.1 virulence protein [Dehalococcoides mccartyi]